MPKPPRSSARPRRKPRNHHGIDPDAPRPSQVARVKIEAHQRHVDAHDPGRSKSLHDACDRQQQERMRERAEDGSDGEECEPHQVNSSIADDLAERGQRQQRDGDRQLVAVDDPDRKRRARVKVLCNGRQRDIGDGAVDHREDEAERDGQDGPIALRGRQAVGVLDCGGRHAVNALRDTAS